MRKALLIGSALAAVAAAAAFAQMPPPGGMMRPMTRADVQARSAEYFKRADANMDGFVTKAEFVAARDAMKAKIIATHEERWAEHRDRMFARLDKDGDGAISKAEFAAAPPAGDHDDAREHHGHGGSGVDGPGAFRGHGMRHNRMRGHDGMGMGMMGGDRWFDQADANKDGKLSLAEAMAPALARFDKVDTNKDGTISSEEHEAAFAAMRGQWKDNKAD